MSLYVLTSNYVKSKHDITVIGAYLLAWNHGVCIINLSFCVSFAQYKGRNERAGVRFQRAQSQTDCFHCPHPAMKSRSRHTAPLRPATYSIQQRALDPRCCYNQIRGKLFRPFYARVSAAAALPYSSSSCVRIVESVLQRSDSAARRRALNSCMNS